MRNDPRCLVTGAVFVTALFSGGCPPTDSNGLDLAVRGRLTLLIERETDSANAEVFGSVNDIKAFLFPAIVLRGDQVLTVNDAAIPQPLGLFSGDVGAVSAPSGYTVAFHDKGITRSVVATPPAAFGTVSPADAEQVSRQGFDVTWTPSGDADVRVELEIRGVAADGPDNDIEPDAKSKSISNLTDNGSTRVGAADLSTFLSGEIELRIKRTRRFSGDLGFAESSIRVVNMLKRSLTLAD